MVRKNHILFSRYLPIGYIALALSFITSLQSCVNIKPGAVKSGKSLYATFFVGEEGTQYFIKPLEFSGNDGDKAIMDMTFRYKDAVKDSAIVNISFVGNHTLKKADSITITSVNFSVPLRNITFMFNESKDKIYISRFSTKCALADVKSLFEGSHWKIQLYKNNVMAEYSTPKATGKKVETLSKSVFALF